MAEKSLLAKYGQDAESRAKRIKMCRRTKTWGNVFVFFNMLSMLYIIFRQMPESSSDAFLSAIALGVCFSAGFILITSMEQEIKICQLLDHIDGLKK
jgi:hypothetical protein